MSGALGFIRSNPAMAGFDAMDQRIARTRQRDQAQATDAAIRAGIADMSSPQVPAAPPPEPLQATPAPSAPAPPATPAPAPALANVRAGTNAPPAPASMYRDPEALARRDALLDAPPAVLAAESARRATAVGQPLHNPATVRPDAPVPGWDAGLPAPTGVINASVGGGTPAAAPVAQQPPPAAPQGQNPRNPYGPILSRLANTPGGGATALGLLQRGETDNRLRDVATARATGQATAAQTRARQATERNILMALGRGEVDLARTFAAQIGMDLPQNITGADEQSRRRFAAGSLLAQRHYGSDPQQAQAFLTTYLQTGDALQALQAAGTPSGASANWRPIWVQRDEQEVLAFFNPRTRQVEFADQPGAAPAAPRAAPAAPAPGGATTPAPPGPQDHPGGPITRPTRSGSAARTPAMETRRQMLINSGIPPEEAGRIAAGYQVTPAQRARAFQAFRSAAEREVFEQDPTKREAEIAQRTRAAMDAWDQETRTAPAAAPAAPQPTAATDPGTPAPATAPATPRAAPAPTAQAPDGTVGRFVETGPDGRHIYRTFNGRRFAVTPGGV